MLTPEQFVASCAHETHVIKHLATKVKDLDYRPTPGQRSMLELMQYMTVMALPPMAYLADGNWDRAPSFGEGIDQITPETFADAMDLQLSRVKEMCPRDGFDNETAMPWGAPCTVGEFLVNAVIKAYACYRMQFFLYCKAAGATDLGPAQCWVGVDPS
ncbi:MAG: hypothetical protein ACYTHK_07120 [Planctomycetota bacterium]|jgi:hypothetical protein